MKYDNRKKADKLTRSRAAEYLTYAINQHIKKIYEDKEYKTFFKRYCKIMTF